MELKKAVAVEVPVNLEILSTGEAVTGITAPVVYLRKPGGAEVVKTITNGVNWFEVGAHFPGVYSLLLSASDTDTAGSLLISVQGGASDVNKSAHYIDDYEQQAQTLLQSISSLEQSMSTTLTAVETAVATLTTAVDGIDTATQASSALDASNQTLLEAVKSVVETLQSLALNRTKIDQTANTFTVYAANGTTPMYVFNLKDAVGNPSVTNIAERVPAT
jgi:uncharacterized protein YoxC